MPKLKTPWDRTCEVDPSRPEPYSQPNEMAEPAENYADAVAPPEPRPVPLLKLQAVIGKDGGVRVPTELLSPVLSMAIAWWRDNSPPEAHGASVEPPPPTLATLSARELLAEGYIDQVNSLIPKTPFLRLAREGAFPSIKIGKKIYAKRLHVEEALIARRRKPRNGTEPQAPDDLDRIRRDMGLVPRGGG